MIKKKLYNMKCLVCGSVYLADRINSATCSLECGEIRARENQDKCRKTEKELNDYFAPKPKEKRKPNLVLPAHEIEEEARKRGMNYGTYSAMLMMEKEREERERRKANV